jgi:hypothetical protein
MFRHPQGPPLQMADFENLLGQRDEGEEHEDPPMGDINGFGMDNGDERGPGRPIDDYEDARSLRTSSRMTDMQDPPNARNYFGRLPSPNLELNLNSNFSRPPYLNHRRRSSGSNTPNNGYRSNNEADQRREQQRMDNPQPPRAASSFAYAGRSRQSFPPDFNPQQPPPALEQQYNMNGTQQQQHFPAPQDIRDQYSNDYTPTAVNQDQPYYNENGFRTAPPQSFHSEPRRMQFGGGGYGFNNNFNNGMFRPRRQWRPPVTNNFNFINIPFNHQFYGYPQQAQQMIDYAQQAASLATLRTSHQHDYNIARNTQRVVPVKEEDEEDIAVLFEGPPKNPKSIISKRKRKSTSINGSCSSPSDDSVIGETSSNATFTSTSQIPSKQSRASSTSVFSSLQVHPFSSAPELAAYNRADVETPIPQMIGLNIGTVDAASNNVDEPEDGEIVEDGDIVEIYCKKSSKTPPFKKSIDNRPILKPKPVTPEVLLDRLPQFMPKPVSAIPNGNSVPMQQPPAEKETAAIPQSILPKPVEQIQSVKAPTNPLYDPLLDDDEEPNAIAEADAVNLDEVVSLLEADAVAIIKTQMLRSEEKAQENEAQVLKQFPELKLSENDEIMDE